MNRPTPLRLRIYGLADCTGAQAGGRVGAPLHVSFERVLANLEALPRMFVEPDGSFLWTGGESGGQGDPWRLEGTVYDDGQVVRYIDLCGDCPLPAWMQFLAALDETPDTVTVQLLENDLIVPGQWLTHRQANED